MKFTKYKLEMILSLLPDFDTYQNETFILQVHKNEGLVFTHPVAPIGIPFYELIFTKNYILNDWESQSFPY